MNALAEGEEHLQYRPLHRDVAPLVCALTAFEVLLGNGRRTAGASGNARTRCGRRSPRSTRFPSPTRIHRGTSPSKRSSTASGRPTERAPARPPRPSAVGEAEAELEARLLEAEAVRDPPRGRGTGPPLGEEALVERVRDGGRGDLGRQAAAAEARVGQDAQMGRPVRPELVPRRGDDRAVLPDRLRRARDARERALGCVPGAAAVQQGQQLRVVAGDPLDVGGARGRTEEVALARNSRCAGPSRSWNGSRSRSRPGSASSPANSSGSRRWRAAVTRLSRGGVGHGHQRGVPQDDQAGPARRAQQGGRGDGHVRTAGGRIRRPFPSVGTRPHGRGPGPKGRRPRGRGWSSAPVLLVCGRRPETGASGAYGSRPSVPTGRFRRRAGTRRPFVRTLAGAGWRRSRPVDVAEPRLAVRRLRECSEFGRVRAGAAPPGEPSGERRIGGSV